MIEDGQDALVVLRLWHWTDNVNKGSTAASQLSLEVGQHCIISFLDFCPLTHSTSFNEILTYLSLVIWWSAADRYKYLCTRAVMAAWMYARDSRRTAWTRNTIISSLARSAWQAFQWFSELQSNVGHPHTPISKHKHIFTPQFFFKFVTSFVEFVISLSQV